MLYHVSVLHSFLLPNNIPSYGWTTFYGSIHQLRDHWVASICVCVTKGTITPQIPSWYSLLREELGRGMDEGGTEAWEERRPHGRARGVSFNVTCAMVHRCLSSQGPSHEGWCRQGTFLKKCQPWGIIQGRNNCGGGRGGGDRRMVPPSDSSPAGP